MCRIPGERRAYSSFARFCISIPVPWLPKAALWGRDRRPHGCIVYEKTAVLWIPAAEESLAADSGDPLRQGDACRSWAEPERFVARRRCFPAVRRARNGQRVVAAVGIRGLDAAILEKSVGIGAAEGLEPGMRLGGNTDCVQTGLASFPGRCYTILICPGRPIPLSKD